MKRIISRRPSGALVIACMSLFVALGGVSYGVATGSIDSREIKNGSVRGADVKDRSLTGSDVADDRLGGRPIKESTLGKVPNAGLLEGQGPAKFTTRWALINESGQIERQTGGFKTVNCYVDNANCYIDAGEDVTNNGLQAQISVNNTDPNSAIFAAQTGVAACFATTVNCTPTGTDTNNGGNPGVFVTTPRASDGGPLPQTLGQDADGPNATAPPAPADAARFYVFVTGSESTP